MTQHQFCRLTDNRVINNQNELWDVRSHLTRADFELLMVEARHGCAFFGSTLDVGFYVTASDRYRYGHCECESSDQLYWDTPGSHLTYNDEPLRTQAEFESEAISSALVTA